MYRVSSILWALVLGIGCNVSSADRYSSTDRPPSEPGKCYAKCLMPSVLGLDTLAYLPIYTGSTPESVEMAEYVVQEAGSSTKWEKVKTVGCQGDQKDCFTWCLKEIHQERIVLSYVVDTLSVKEYALEAVVEQRMGKEGETAWKEVLCQKDLRNNTYTLIAEKLRDRGYITDTQLLKANGQFDKNIKSALRKFQMDNDLPIGQLDLETLGALGYSY